MKILLILPFLIMTSANASEVISINSKNLPELLKAENLEIKSMEIGLESVNYRKGFLRRSFMPKLNLSGGLERFSSGPYSGLTQPYGEARAEINIFNGMKDYYQNELINEQSKEKSLGLEIGKRTTLLELRKIYWEYLFKVGLIKIIREGLEFNSQNLKSAKNRSNSGISTRTDIIEFEQNQNFLEQKVERLEAEILYHQAQIRSYLFLEEDRKLEFKEALYHDHGEEAVPQSLNSQLSIPAQMTLSQTNAILIEKNIYQWGWKPTIDLYAAAEQFTQKERDYSHSKERKDYSFGVKVSFDLFDGGESYNTANYKNLSAQSLAYSHKSILRKEKIEFDHAVNMLNLVDRQLHGAEESAKRSEIYYKNTLSEYKRGIKNSPDVLGASQSFIEAKERVIELEKDYQMAKATMDHFLGQ